MVSMQTQGLLKLQALNELAKRAIHSAVFAHQMGKELKKGFIRQNIPVQVLF
jgi:hypothetical protein